MWFEWKNLSGFRKRLHTELVINTCEIQPGMGSIFSLTPEKVKRGCSQ
jgi:hypothetical protein